MRENNAQRVIYNFLSGKFYHPASDQMRVDESSRIYDRGTIIGYFVEDELDEVWTKYLVLPFIDFKTDKSWKRKKQQLAKVANEMGIRVVFQKEWNYGFEDTIIDMYPQLYYNCCIPLDELYPQLISIARYSTDDVKTAVCVNAKEDDIYYSFNQNIEGKFIHAEKILVDFIRLTNSKDTWRWVSLLEPCADYILSMIGVGARYIYFSEMHKDKWNTQDYIQLTNDLAFGHVRTNRGIVVKYNRCKNDKVTKFMKRR